MSSNENTDFYLIDSLRIFHGLSLRKLAKDAGLDASSLSYTLRGIESRVSRERLKPALKLLGLGDDGLLSAGVHKWSTPTISSEDIERVEKTIKKFFPRGGYVHQIRLAGILNPINTPSLVTSYSQIAWSLVPNYELDVRILLSIGHHSRMKQLLHFPPWGILFRPANFGKNWVWADGSDSSTDSPSSWQNIPRQKFNDLMEKDLSVQEFDEILGLNYEAPLSNGGSFAFEEGKPYGLTWEEVVRKAKEAGLNPAEVAKRLGLSE